MIDVHDIQERLWIPSDAQRLRQVRLELAQTPCGRFELIADFGSSQLATHASKWLLLKHTQKVRFASANLLGDAWTHPAVRQ